MLELIVKLVFSYCIGTVMGGMVMGRLHGGVDLRVQGSGNVGASNALRTQGAGFAIAVLAIDVIKGVIAALLIPDVAWPWPGALGGGGLQALPYACGTAAALGHIYPAWFGFKGGKGAATLTGIYGALLPTALPWMLASFVLVLVFTGYAGLSTLTAALTALLYVTCFDEHGIFSAAGVFTLAMASLVFYTHRGNLLRVWQGRESRFERVMIFRRWLGP